MFVSTLCASLGGKATSSFLAECKDDGNTSGTLMGGVRTSSFLAERKDDGVFIHGTDASPCSIAP